MSQRQTRQTRYVTSFEAASRSGELISLRVVEDVTSVTTYFGTGQSIDTPRYVGDDGGVVMKRLGVGEYEHRVSGVVYVSADPIAPCPLPSPRATPRPLGRGVVVVPRPPRAPSLSHRPSS